MLPAVANLMGAQGYAAGRGGHPEEKFTTTPRPLAIMAGSKARITPCAPLRFPVAVVNFLTTRAPLATIAPVKRGHQPNQTGQE